MFLKEKKEERKRPCPLSAPQEIYVFSILVFYIFLYKGARAACGDGTHPGTGGG